LLGARFASVLLATCGSPDAADDSSVSKQALEHERPCLPPRPHAWCSACPLLLHKRPHPAVPPRHRRRCRRKLCGHRSLCLHAAGGHRAPLHPKRLRSADGNADERPGCVPLVPHAGSCAALPALRLCAPEATAPQPPRLAGQECGAACLGARVRVHVPHSPPPSCRLPALPSPQAAHARPP
jgi:hypothetical protein